MGRDATPGVHPPSHKSIMLRPGPPDQRQLSSLRLVLASSVGPPIDHYREFRPRYRQAFGLARVPARDKRTSCLHPTDNRDLRIGPVGASEDAHFGEPAEFCFDQLGQCVHSLELFPKEELVLDDPYLV